MGTDAKKLASNARYLSKFKTMYIRILPEEFEKLKTCADAEEKGSIQGYVLASCRTRMQQDTDRETYSLELPAELVKSSAADLGITPAAFVEKCRDEVMEKWNGDHAYREVEACDPLLKALSSLTLEQREALTIFLQRLG